MKKRDIRLSKLNKIANEEETTISLINKVKSMSKQEQQEFVHDFIKKNGIGTLISLIRGIGKNTVQSKVNNFRLLKLSDVKRPYLYEKFNTQKPEDSKAVKALKTLTSASELLTFLCLIGVTYAGEFGKAKEVLEAFAIVGGAGLITLLLSKLTNIARK
jgi:hypothetical protein